MPSLHQEFKSVVVIKRFMSYLKSAGVSKVNRALWTHFSAGAVDLTGVCFRKPDVCVWNLLFATKCVFFFFGLCKPFPLLFSSRPHHSPQKLWLCLRLKLNKYINI